MNDSESIDRKRSMICSFSPAVQITVYLADASRNPTNDTAIDKTAIDSWTTPRPPASDEEYWNGVTALTASEQFFRYPLTALRATLRNDENSVAKDKRAVVRL
jgi:hypothetical protein